MKNDNVNKVKGKKARQLREEQFKKRFTLGLIIFTAVFVLASAILVYVDYANSYVAKLKGEKISVAEYRYFFSNEEYYMLTEVKDPEMDEETFWNTKIDGQSPVDITKNKALESARAFNIEVIRAKEKKIKLTDYDRDQAQTYVDSMMGEYYQTRAAKDEYLRASIGITYNEYKRIIEDYFLVLKFRSEIMKGIEVSDTEIVEYYEANKDDIDKVTINHMLIEFDRYLDKDEDGKTVEGATLTDEQKEKARGDAVAILARVQEGESYEEILKDFYGDEYNKDEMQYELQFSKSEAYLDEIKTWAFEHKVDDTGMIESKYGYHVVKLTKRTVFEDVKDAAKEALLAEKYSEQLEVWKKDPEYNIKMNDRVFNGIE
ncbi:MAG: peptidyl-prolyl cis-trans isomerase [Eubacteriales bacterium]|nr:peptidyl-prolyl cis-trans isomerase [Eubacteriales bacterium]